VILTARRDPFSPRVQLRGPGFFMSDVLCSCYASPFRPS
jgi:hypothetical protein